MSIHSIPSPTQDKLSGAPARPTWNGSDPLGYDSMPSAQQGPASDKLAHLHSILQCSHEFKSEQWRSGLIAITGTAGKEDKTRLQQARLGQRQQRAIRARKALDRRGVIPSLCPSIFR
eukprot:41113-Rhodomonas_salina.3